MIEIETLKYIRMKSCPKKRDREHRKLMNPLLRMVFATDDSYDAYQLLADGQNLTHLMMANLCNNSHKWSPTQIVSMK